MCHFVENCQTRDFEEGKFFVGLALAVATVVEFLGLEVVLGAWHGVAEKAIAENYLECDVNICMAFDTSKKG
jgi:hypothetical protein